jgi:glucose-1-phosphate adenylyltransferase
MHKQECIAMLLAGGQGSRLGPLTRNIAKPAVSFSGKYRIIDFSLSNCSNSNINTVGILTQYKPFLLNSYIVQGSAWDLDAPGGGVHILPPYLGENEGSWYKGTADAVYQNMEFIDFYDPDYVLIISGDHIYKMNYNEMLKFHKEKEADITVSTLTVPWEEASRFGLVTCDENARIIRFSEKPAEPETNLASMGVYIFNWKVLKLALIEDSEDPISDNDFGKNILPRQVQQDSRVFAYNFQGYWKDVGTIESYYQANMECLNGGSTLNIFDPRHKIYSNEDILPPQYVGPAAKIENSIVCNGCNVLGEVSNSILAQGVFVGEGVCIKDSILLPHAKVYNQTHIFKSIIGERAEIREHSIIGANLRSDSEQEGITVIEDHQLIPMDSVIDAGRNLYRLR